MAPILSRKRAAEAKASQLEKPLFEKNSFPVTKDDKRRIKRSTFVSRIEKAGTSKPKRRRPSKKLVTTLGALADALPDTTDDAQGGVELGNARINRHKSLRSRPGALKKKAKVEAIEKDRFRKNLAQMAADPQIQAQDAPQMSTNQEPNTSRRWAALRNFIGATLDKGPVDIKKSAS